MLQKLLLLTSLVGLPVLGLAQTTPTTGFYLGAGANLITDVPFYSAGVTTLVGPSLTAGFQFSPRLAVQVSAAYHWRKKTYDFSGYYYGSGGAVIGYGTETSRYKYLTLPVLLRYTFTAPTARFHVDGLAGVTTLHSSYNYSSTSTIGSSGYFPHGNSSSTKASLTLGPAVRYRVSSRVEVTANGLVNGVLGDTYTHFSDRLFVNAFVGAQYLFGR